MNRILGRIVTATSVLALSAVLVAPVVAANTATSADQSLSITPPTRELSVKRGDVVQGTVDVSNIGTADVTLYPIVRDFQANSSADQAAPDFFETTPASYTAGLSQWVTFTSDKLTVPAKGTASANYTITVPANAEPGGHFGAVFLSTQPPASAADANSVAISTRAGSLLLLTVAGNIKLAGNLAAYAQLDSKNQPRVIFEKLPVTLKYTFENTGNVQFVPTGTIVVTNSAGATVATQTFNSTGGRVLPSSKRNFTEVIDGKLGYGKFAATTTLNLVASNGDKLPVTQSSVFWVLPLTAIIITVLVLIVLIVLFKLWLSRHDAAVRGARK